MQAVSLVIFAVFVEKKPFFGRWQKHRWPEDAMPWVLNLQPPNFAENHGSTTYLGWPRSTVEKGPYSDESYERENPWNRTISTVLWVHKKQLPQSAVKLILPSNESYESRTGCNRTLATVLWVPLNIRVQKRAEYGFGEYGFKHRTQWVFRGSLSSGERTQWVPLSLLFVCQTELTEFDAELTEFAPKLSEFSSPKQCTPETVFRYRFLEYSSGTRLQSEFWRERFFFSRHEFSHEKCSEIFPETFEPLLSLTLQPLLFWKSKGNPPKKARVLFFAEPLKSLEKEGKRTKKARKIGKRRKARKSKKARIGGSGLWVRKNPAKFRPNFPHNFPRKKK